MINELILVGKIKKMPSEYKNEEKFEIEVKRNYKESNGEFKKDTFECTLWIAIRKKIEAFCKFGDIVCVRGRLVNEKNSCDILAEQVVLLNREN